MECICLFGTKHEYPSGPADPENPAFQRLKKLIELEFYNHFDTKVDITNWEYILQRASAYKIKN